MKREIIPAIMPTDYEDLTSKISRVSHLVKWAQIDVMDGKFVKSTSWPYKKYKHFEEMIKQEEGLPHWEDLNFEIDLMTLSPQAEIPKWIEIGVSRVIIHIASLEDPRSIDLEGNRNTEESNKNFLKKLKEDGLVEVCLAITPNIPNSELDKYKDLYDSVQFMGIEHVGYQGEEFVPEVLNKIKEFRKENSEANIGIDGGVNFDTIEDLVEAGANRLVSGSALFNAIDLKEALDDMKDLIS